MPDQNLTNPAIEVRQCHRKRIEAWLRGDLEAYMSYYWSDALIFIDRAPFSLAEMREGAAAELAARERIGIDAPDLEAMAISEMGDAVTVSFPWSQRVRGAEGNETTESYHETDVWYRRSSAWKLIAIHLVALVH
ncbi:MAG: nuclear transport factor 2 family protein [Dongiaceae bacterium]